MTRLPLSLSVTAFIISAGGPGLPEEQAFKRIAFDVGVPVVGEDVATIAAGGRLAAYGAEGKVHFVDARTGERLASHEVTSPFANAPETTLHVVGIRGTRVYAVASYHAQRPAPLKLKPGEFAATTLPRTLRGEAVAVNVKSGEVKRIFELPVGFVVGEGLLGTSLVYTVEETLHVAPLDGKGQPRSFDLRDLPSMRASAANGFVKCVCQSSVCFYGPGDKDVTRLPFGKTDIGKIHDRFHFYVQRIGDTVVVAGKKEAMACTAAGRRIWSAPVGGRLATGPKGEICLLDGPIIFRLSPDDGKVLWRRPLPFIPPYGGSNDIEGFRILGGRLFAVGRRATSIYDVETGEVLVDMALEVKDNRGWRSGWATTARVALADDSLVVALSNRFYGISLTPTAKVPPGQRGADPASPAVMMAAFRKAKGSEREQVAALARIGSNMEDIPELVPQVLPDLKRLLGSAKGRNRFIGAFHWLDDPVVTEGLVSLVKDPDVDEYRKPYFVELLACRASGPARSALRAIAADAKGVPTKVRVTASRHLRLLGDKEELSKGDLRLLYSGDHDAAVAAFAERLSSEGNGVRGRALELLRMAPDAVVARLSDELAGLPEGKERDQGSELVRRAKGRTAAIVRYHVKPDDGR